MLKVDIKQGLLLLIYAFILNEVLSLPTLVFVLITFLTLIFNKRPKKYLRNTFALLVLASYLFMYGRVIDPEVGLNFLVTVIALKLMEKEGRRDEYMIFFGLLLLVSAGSLFEKTLSYMLFFGLAFFILIQDFYQGLGMKGRLRELGVLLLWVLPLTGLMFFFVPRLMNPIPFQYGRTGEGEVGYTPNVNLAGLESLTSNDSPAFQAITDMEIPQDSLYWRGNTLSQNDGWNWFLTSRDYGENLEFNGKVPNRGIVQNVRLYTKEDYFFTLDYASYVTVKDKSYSLRGPHSLNQRGWQWSNQYVAVSFVKGEMSNDEDPLPYLRVFLSKRDKDWVAKVFKGENFPEVKKEISEYFLKNSFSYSLSPGKIESFRDFMITKRIGLCSHYASATAIILRSKNIPARLVSGYMGGNYNPYANYYLVSQNDAHVWVEALHNGKWMRIDPTEWIAPERVRLGGEAFMTAISTGNLGGFSVNNTYFRWLKDIKLWFEQWDFKFYQWLEQMDYFTQDAWLSQFKIKRQWLYVLGPALILIFSFLYIWQLSRKKIDDGETEIQKIWMLFLGKLRKRQIDLPLESIRSAEERIHQIDDSDKELILEIWKELLGVSYAGVDIQAMSLKTKIQKL